jgi:hypothetical protein
MAQGSKKTHRIYHRMESPIDHIVDLGLVNYVPHPENKNYIVFRFADLERAKSFEKCLNEEKIWFERGEEEKRSRTIYLFGVHNRDFNKAQKLNFKVEGMHKKPIIPFKALRWSLIVFAGIIMTLTLVGYCQAQKTLEEANKATEQSIDK